MKIALALGLLAAPLVLAGTPTAAQTWTSRYAPPPPRQSGPTPARRHRPDVYRRGHDFNGQADVPGDYPCDAFWDRGRDDCGAAWRDQRPFGSRTDRAWSSSGASRYSTRPPAPDRGYDYDDHAWFGSPQVIRYYGAYGWPDLIYPAVGSRPRARAGADAHGRGPGRIDWCRATYRSYDPRSGSYRALDGRLVFCG